MFKGTKGIVALAAAALLVVAIAYAGYVGRFAGRIARRHRAMPRTCE